MTSIILEKINEEITSLKNSFEANKNIKHSGVKGSFNEEGLKELICKIISQKYGVTSGIIENSEGHQSNETDIVIYDDEIIPSYIKNQISFVPIESVIYNFEVKSTLNATEIKTTSSKFKKFRAIGGTSPTVLFAYSSDLKGSELQRYHDIEEDFFTDPLITVICVSGKGYYFKDETEYYLKDLMSKEDFLKSVTPYNKMEEMLSAFENSTKSVDFLNSLDRAGFLLMIEGLMMSKMNSNLKDKDIIINDLKFEDIKVIKHEWHGIECQSNEIELGLLSGISNTLSKGLLGKYLMRNASCKLFSVCFEDMWGNISYKQFNKDGLKETDYSFKFKSSQNKHSLTVTPN